MMGICRGNNNLKPGHSTSDKNSTNQTLNSLNQRRHVLEPIPRYQIYDDDDSLTSNGSMHTTNQVMVSNSNPICITRDSATSLFPNEQARTCHLLESLIYSSCERIESNPEKCRALFVHICEYLEKCNFLGTSYKIDALHRNRQFLGSKFNCILLELKNQVSGCPALPCSSELPSINLGHHQLLNSGAPFTVPIEPKRWQHEFLDKKLIEKGGFGVVHQARHYLDDVVYAVKEISFRFKTPQDFLRIVREVQLYANLPSHPHVVAYKTAWIDNELVDLKETSKTRHRMKRCSESDKEDLLKVPNFREFDLKNLVEEDEGSSIQFKEISEEGDAPLADIKVVVNDVVDGNVQSVNTFARCRSADNIADLAISDSVVDYGVHRPVKTISPKKNEDGDCMTKKYQYKAILYIQMELCGQNLKRWIRNRNERFFRDRYPEASPLLNEDGYKFSLNLFKQILKGVEFLHEHHLIHRDLKPQNIFFDSSGDKVKIGDFGLATLHDDDVIVEHSPVGRRDSTFFGFDHSKGLGTTIYMAPEQKNSTRYDVKADMFSLGIVFWELMQPFQTRMEKGKTLDDLKSKSILPTNFVETYPEAAAVIINLTSEPHHRPTASQVLRSPLFKSKDQLILDQQEEIDKLRLELKNLKIELRQREQDIRERDQIRILMESVLRFSPLGEPSSS